MPEPLRLDRPAYLGLDREAHWADLLAEGIARYGAHYAGSRRAAYCPDVYEVCETALATFTATPAACLLSSATLAAVLTLDVLRERRFTVLVGPLAHAAWRRRGSVAEFDDEEAWRRRAARLLSAGQSVALVTDRVDAIGARASDLSWLAQLGAGRGRLLVLVDDSHALGALDDGRGSYATLRGSLPAEVDLLTVASLGKAFSSPGALVAGAPWAVRALVDSTGFAGASPLPPAYAFALLRGATVQGEVGFFAERLRLLREQVAQLEALGLRGSHVAGHPVFRLTDERQVSLLRAADVVLSELVYPGPPGPPAVRLVARAGVEGAVARVAGALN